MDHAEAQTFVDRWVQAWNAHDVERVLSNFAEDVVFTSPLAAQLMRGSDGVLRGKAALREYWLEGLRRVPDLHFEVVAVYVGVHTIVVTFRNHKNAMVNEVLIFDGPLVVQGHGTYAPDSAAFLNRSAG